MCVPVTTAWRVVSLRNEGRHPTWSVAVNVGPCHTARRVLKMRMEERPPIWSVGVNVGLCHHGMARPQVADGGTASYMEGSCECGNLSPGHGAS
jgi:hypothetical protein